MKLKMGESLLPPEDDIGVQAARTLLLRFYIANGEPRWSSTAIEEMWHKFIFEQQNRISDFYKALFELLREYDYSLTQISANFIMAISDNGRRDLRTSFASMLVTEDFSWMVTETENELTAAQAFLLGLAAPRSYLGLPSFVIGILQPLIDEQVAFVYWDWITSRFYSYFDDDTKIALKICLNTGIPSPYREDLEAILEDRDQNDG